MNGKPNALEEAGVFFNDGQVTEMTTRKWYVDEGQEPCIKLRLRTADQLFDESL